MALIKSTILAQISGSINGTTFGHSRGGAYARNRSIPINPGTDRQDQVRTSLASLAQAWRDTLTDTQRALWRNYGANLQVKNRLGDTINLSGIAAFQRINMFRLASLNLPMIDEPPAAGLNPNPAPSFVSSTITQATGDPPTMDIGLANTSASGYGLLVYYSGPISPGKSYYRGPYIAHGTTPIAGATASFVMAALGTDDTYAGQKVAAKITCYDTTSNLPVWTIYIDPTTLPVAV